MNKDYFKLAEKAYEICLPIFTECAGWNISEREVYKKLKDPLSDLTGYDLSSDLDSFLGCYFSFDWAKRDYQQKLDASSFAPYWMYVCNSPRCRHLHKSLDKLVYKYDDLFWNKYFIPNSWNCACRIHNFTEDELKEKEHRFRKPGDFVVQIKPPFDFNPAIRDWKPVYEKLFIQHFVALLYEADNYEWNEEDEE